MTDVVAATSVDPADVSMTAPTVAGTRPATPRRIALPSFALRRRIAALVALSVFAAVLIVAVASWIVVHRQLTNQTDAALSRETSAAVAGSTPIDPLQLPKSFTGLALPLQVIYSSGQVKSPPGQAVQLPYDSRDLAVARGQRSAILRDVTAGDMHLRMITMPDGSGVALQVAQDLSAQDSALHKLALLLFAASIGGAALGAAAGVAVARAGLRPVRDLTAEAERVARTDDLAPLVLTGRGADDDEVARLAAAFNTMLAALANSRERQRQLVADAGHELRTPLTSLRTNLELLVREDPAEGRLLPPDDRHQLMADLVAQIEELSTLVGDLTALARDESRTVANSEDVDLAEITERAVTRVRRRAPTVRIVTDLHASVVRGRPPLLERAITNLLDNATKWSPTGGEVYVGLRDGVLVVADQGPGIAAEDLPHVFERFYRARTAREMPGSGLGLSIVAQTAAEHGGVASAERIADGGTRMRLSIPLVDVPGPATAPSQG